MQFLYKNSYTLVVAKIHLAFEHTLECTPTNRELFQSMFSQQTSVVLQDTIYSKFFLLFRSMSHSGCTPDIGYGYSSRIHHRSDHRSEEAIRQCRCHSHHQPILGRMRHICHQPSLSSIDHIVQQVRSLGHRNRSYFRPIQFDIWPGFPSGSRGPCLRAVGTGSRNLSTSSTSSPLFLVSSSIPYTRYKNENSGNISVFSHFTWDIRLLSSTFSLISIKLKKEKIFLHQF